MSYRLENGPPFRPIWCLVVAIIIVLAVTFLGSLGGCQQGVTGQSITITRNADGSFMYESTGNNKIIGNVEGYSKRPDGTVVWFRLSDYATERNDDHALDVVGGLVGKALDKIPDVPIP